jgi:hypothetical protein
MATEDSAYIQPNFGHGLRIWWAFFWPTSLIATIVTIASNYLLRRFYETSDVPGYLIGPVMKYDAILFTYVAALFVMDYLLQKNFRHFRLALLSHRGGPDAQELDSTLGRALRVWWTYSWRTFIYRLIVIFVTTIPTGVIVGVFTRMPLLQSLVRFVLLLAIDGAVGLFVIYSNILDEDFGDFRVCLFPLPKETVSPIAPAATPAQT